MWAFIGALLGVLCAVGSTLGQATEGEAAIQVWHSFDGTTFHFRSSFVPSKIETGFRHTTVKDGYNGVPADLEELYKEAVRRNGLYTIRVSSDPYSSAGPYVLASVPMCELFKYGFREEIILHFNADSSTVVGVEYTATPTPMVRTCDVEKATTPALFQTKMKEADRVVAQTVPVVAQGPKPSYLNHVKLASGAEGVDPNAPPVQQSFLRKYWYVVVPLVIVFLFGGGAPAEGEVAAGSAPAAAAAK